MGARQVGYPLLSLYPPVHCVLGGWQIDCDEREALAHIPSPPGRWEWEEASPLAARQDATVIQDLVS